MNDWSGAVLFLVMFWIIVVSLVGHKVDKKEIKKIKNELVEYKPLELERGDFMSDKEMRNYTGGRFFFDVDDSGHWYIVEEEHRKEWNDWSERLQSGDESDSEAPDFAKRVNGDISKIIVVGYEWE